MNKNIKKGKIEHLIRDSMSKILMDFGHIGFVTVMRVILSDDFSTASIFISSFGLETDAVIEELNSHTGFFRKKIAKNLNLRYTPNLVFKQDHEMEFDNG